MALSTLAQVNRSRVLLKSLPARPGGDAARQGSGPEAWFVPLGHTGIKERLFQTGSYRGEGSQAVAGRPAAFVSQATSGGEWRSRKSRRWLIHGLACRLWVDMHASVCVSKAHSRWQIGKATDGPGSISTAGCCDVSILPSLTTAGQTRAVRVIACVCGCVSLSLFRLWVCCFNIRTTITLFAKCNKGKSLSWRSCCRTVATANIVNENTRTQQLCVSVSVLCKCVIICSWVFQCTLVNDCVYILFLFTNACTTTFRGRTR